MTLHPFGCPGCLSSGPCLRDCPEAQAIAETVARCARGEHRAAGESMPDACADCGVDWNDLEDR